VPRSAPKGANLVRVRAHNERLVLTELRTATLSRAQLSRRTGLSAQTITQIVRALLEDGLVQPGAPVRGRVGQPSVPLSLAPHGAWFTGLAIGRRSAELVLMDFSGCLVKRRTVDYRWPEPDRIVRFVVDAWPDLVSGIEPGRLHGLGIAQPFFLWEWSDRLGAPLDTFERWRDADIDKRLSRALDQTVFVENDASAACGAELTFGRQRARRDFVHLYIGWFIGGGVVLDGALHTGANGNAGALGPLRVPDPKRPGATVALLDIASIRSLELLYTERPVPPDAPVMLNDEHAPGWCMDPDLVALWSGRVGTALAQAAVSICSVLDVSALVIDGPFPGAVRDDIVGRTRTALGALDTRGVLVPDIVPGSLGSTAPVLGAARQPLFARFLLDQAVLTDIGAA